MVFSTARALAAIMMPTVPFLYREIGYSGLHMINGAMYIIPALLVLFLGEKTAQKSLEELEIEG